MTGKQGDPELEALLEFLRRARGFDFGGYKRASLERRFRRRMQAVGCESFSDYRDFLEVHPDEFAALFDTLLINVTSFFRDPSAWHCMQETILPRLLGERDDDRPIRVWSAGCSSGEEAYTVAMILCELLGDEAYRERVKIYATDIDEAALSKARQGHYGAKELEAVPEHLRDRYFRRNDERFAFRPDLRRSVIFGRNNLLDDAPISRLDLLVCRNTLMYFTAESQGHILRHFHFALSEGGALMLGRSEMMLSQHDRFETVDLRERIFRRLAEPPSLQARVARLADDDQLEIPLSDDERLSRDVALEVGVVPHLIVSRTGLLTFANQTARALFGIPLEALGKPFQDLELSYQPAELRGPVDEALRERRLVTLGEVTLPSAEDGERTLEVTATPLLADGEPPLGVSIVFTDVTHHAATARDLESSRRDLELAYEELQSTIDELETTNEELQSANEELQTTNEELQSTNEELETMNEELQSTNEELETINDELRDRTAELNRVNELLEKILTSLGMAVAVVDGDHRVQIWNHLAEDLWGVRREEAVHSDFLELDMGLPTDRLASPLRVALGGEQPDPVELEAVNRRGRTIACATTIRPLRSGNSGGAPPRGAIILMQNLSAEGSAR